MKEKINLFVAWFLTLQIFLSPVVAQFGTWLLGVLGMPAPLHEKFGWLVGALTLISVMLIVRHALGELPPGTGKPDGKGYKLGHGLVLASSLLASGVYVLPFFIQDIQNPGNQVVLSSLAVGFMYPALGLFGIGLSFIYQSTLTAVADTRL